MGFQLNKSGLRARLVFLGLDVGFHFKQSIFGFKRAVGVRNISGKGMNFRVLFGDYDFVDLKNVLIPELIYLQNTYSLSDFYIFKSSQKADAYHVICLDNLPVGEWQGILQETSCDMAYKNPLYKDFRSDVLRITPKGSSDAPVFIQKLKSRHNSRQKSLAHAKFLKFQHGINIDLNNTIHNWDGNEKIIFVDYPTKNLIK